MIKHGKRFEGVIIAKIEKGKIYVSHEIVNTAAKICYLGTHA